MSLAGIVIGPILLASATVSLVICRVFRSGALSIGEKVCPAGQEIAFRLQTPLQAEYFRIPKDASVKGMVGELVAMVGGAGERTRNRTSAEHLAQKGGSHFGSKSVGVHKRTGKSKGPARPGADSADEFLPMGEGNDLKEF